MADIYVRLSTDPRMDYIGVENQLEACRKFIADRGMVEGRTFLDNDVSAVKVTVVRPAFEELLRSRPKAIVVWHTDRLVRRSDDLERVIDLDVNVYAVQAGHLDLSTPAGRAVARTVTAWATYEGEQRNLRASLAYEARAARGEPGWGRRPFGHEKDGSLRESEAAIVRELASRVLTGTPLYALAKELNERGIKTAYGKAWSKTSVRQLLQSSRVAGIKTFRGEELGKGNWDPILDEEEWRSLVALFKLPSRRNGPGRARKHLLTGIARCGACKGGLSVQRDNKGRRVYVCREKFCINRRQSLIDTIVEQRIFALVRRHAAEREAVEAPQSSEAMREVDDLQAQLDELAEAYATGDVTLSQMTTASRIINERLDVAKAALGETQTAPTLQRLVAADDPEEEWGLFDLGQKRALIESLVTIEIMPQRDTGLGRLESVVVERRQRPEPSAPALPA